MKHERSLRLLLILIGSALSIPFAQAETYRLPPEELVRLVDAPRTPLVNLGPTREWLLMAERPPLPPIAELAEPELRLAGLRIRPRWNGPSRSRPFTGLKFLRVSDGQELELQGLPREPRLHNLEWSPDGKRLAFAHQGEEGLELWVAEVETARAHHLIEAPLNLVVGRGLTWEPDSRSLLATLIPAERGPEPPATKSPVGPVVQEASGRAAPVRTYQDLLESPRDEALLEHYATSRLVRVSLDGEMTPLGEPGIFWSAWPSPGGRHILVERLHRPYSYRVPAHRFPRRIEVWDRDGHPVATVADRPLQEEVPIAHGSVITGRRNVTWRSDSPATLCWVEALDGGDGGAPADLRDRVVLQDAPFRKPPRTLMELPYRFTRIHWGTDRLALISEHWWGTRRTRTWRVQPGRPGSSPELLIDRSWEDRYGDPGSPVLRPNAAGWSELHHLRGERSLLFLGEGASPEGNRPFLDRFDLDDGETRRLFQSEPPHFERPIAPLDEKARRLLTRRESLEEPPNYFVRGLRPSELRPLTDIPHPHPELSGLRKEMIRYPRADGVELTATLYLPPDWSPAEGSLPTLIQAYPRAFQSADAPGQVTGSPHRFIRIGWWSPLAWAVRGYAVLDRPAIPIVGGDDANDTFVEQLVAGAQAAVDELVRRGVADPDRIAVTGQSYGAFMTANLLAHSDLFAAGIARTGAYNRTLTPFGFQSEDRSLWDAPEVYLAMSPLLYAHQIDEPLLLIHGQADSNPGTFPMQSERLYEAIQGLGGTARLVMLPHESHSYRARESILHTLWEVDRWLERYVQKTPTRPSNSSTSGRQAPNPRCQSSR